MTWIAVAVGGGALLGGVASSIGSSNAAKTQANAANENAQIQQNEFNTITQQETPYMQAGYGALGSLDYLLGINPITSGQAAPGGGGIANINGSGPVTGNTPAVLQTGATSSAPSTPNSDIFSKVMAGNGSPWTGIAATAGNSGPSLTPTMGVVSAPLASLRGNSSTPPSVAGGYGSLNAPFTADMMQQYSPAYQFQREQGMQGTLNGSSTGQGALSGAAQQALVGFNQNLANTAFGNAFNQYQTQQGNTYSRLAGIAQLGQTAAANTGQQGTSIAASTGQAIQNAGTALAGGQVGVANSISGSLGAMSTIPYLNNLNYQNEMNQLTPVNTTAQYI